jgi:hypothetical protein
MTSSMCRMGMAALIVTGIGCGEPASTPHSDPTPGAAAPGAPAVESPAKGPAKTPIAAPSSSPRVVD